MLALPACAETPGDYLGSLDILSQLDERVADVSSYAYNGKPFRQNGCQPTSITNAMVAAIGDPTVDSPALLLELLRLMCPGGNPRSGLIDTGRLRYLNTTEYSDKYPVLNSCLQGFSAVIATPYVLETDKLVEEIRQQGDARFMMTTKFSLKKHWDWLVDFTEALNNAGYGDMRFAMASLGAGTPGTVAPFRVDGARGHYVAIYLNVAEFCESGTIYLLDSLPRALTGEDYGEGQFYGKSYEFRRPRYQRDFAHFNDVYTVSRVSPTVLKVSLLPEHLQVMQAQRAALAADPALLPQYIALRSEQLTPLQFYGAGLVFLTNP